jgi:hypothetical protein
MPLPLSWRVRQSLRVVGDGEGDGEGDGNKWFKYMAGTPAAMHV